MREREPVVIVVDEQDIVVAPARGTRGKARLPRWPSRAIGISLTVLVHLLISSSFVLGTAAHKRKPSPDGSGTTAWASEGQQQSDSMILLDLSAMSSSDDIEAPRTTPSESALLEQLPLMLVGREPTPPPDVTIDEDASESDKANQAAGDPSGSAVMFGKYMGQVAARIDRAWMRPRAPIDSGHFDCRVRVMQDRAGNVLSLNLEQCSGDATWRRSLESAILRASPLSAPPEPRLFTESLSLNFSADQYQAGVTPDYLYEPAPVRVAAAAPLDIFTTTDEPREQSPVESASGDVELTITGSQVMWKKKASVTTKQ